MGGEQERRLELAGLIDLTRWQRLQDHFTNVFGLGLRAVSPRRALLSTPSWPPSIDGSRVVEALRLGQEVEVLLPAEALPKEFTTTTTPLGVSFAVIPLRAPVRPILGYLVAGPVVLGKREEPEAFRRRTAALGMDGESAWSVFLTVKVFTVLNFRSALELLEETTGMWLEMAYQLRELKADMAQTARTKPAVAAYYAERLLQSLLEIATSATDAEGGSVMLYEPSSDTLRIAVAQGLEAPMLTTTRVKPQESLAGLAMQRRQALVVDEEVDDAQVRQRMHRRELASSVVVPLLSDATATPVGVLSVRTSQAVHRFTLHDVELLHNLAALTQTALSNLSLLEPEA